MSSIYSSPKPKSSVTNLVNFPSSASASTSLLPVSSNVGSSGLGSGSSYTTHRSFSHHHDKRHPGYSNYDSRLIALAMEGQNASLDEDVWQGICIRVLPLFNGEGHKGFIEDINELVSLYGRHMIETHGNDALRIIVEDVNELITDGMFTLESKLSDLRQEKFLSRLNELWSFFLTGILPYLQGIFLPLSTDPTLATMVQVMSSMNLNTGSSSSTGHSSAKHHSPPPPATSSTTATNSSTTYYGNYNNANIDSERSTIPSSRGSATTAAATSTIANSQRFDVRKLALIGFRDHIVIPHLSQLSLLLDPQALDVNDDDPSLNDPDSSFTQTRNLSLHSHAKRIQMFSILLTVQTDGPQHDEIKRLLWQVLQLSRKQSEALNNNSTPGAPSPATAPQTSFTTPSSSRTRGAPSSNTGNKTSNNLNNTGNQWNKKFEKRRGWVGRNSRIVHVRGLSGGYNPNVSVGADEEEDEDEEEEEEQGEEEEEEEGLGPQAQTFESDFVDNRTT